MSQTGEIVKFLRYFQEQAERRSTISRGPVYQQKYSLQEFSWKILLPEVFWWRPVISRRKENTGSVSARPVKANLYQEVLQYREAIRRRNYWKTFDSQHLYPDPEDLCRVHTYLCRTAKQCDCCTLLRLKRLKTSNLTAFFNCKFDNN